MTTYNEIQVTLPGALSNLPIGHEFNYKPNSSVVSKPQTWIKIADDQFQAQDGAVLTIEEVTSKICVLISEEVKHVKKRSPWEMGIL